MAFPDPRPVIPLVVSQGFPLTVTPSRSTTRPFLGWSQTQPSPHHFTIEPSIEPFVALSVQPSVHALRTTWR